MSAVAIQKRSGVVHAVRLERDPELREPVLMTACGRWAGRRTSFHILQGILVVPVTCSTEACRLAGKATK